MYVMRYLLVLLLLRILVTMHRFLDILSSSLILFPNFLVLVICVSLYCYILRSTFLELLKLPLHFLELSLCLFYLLCLNILILLLGCLFSFGLLRLLMLLLFLLLYEFLNSIHCYHCLLGSSSLVLVLLLMYCCICFLLYQVLHIQLFLCLHSFLFHRLVLVFVLIFLIFRYSLLLYLILLCL